jgi:hypothetical protein
VGDVVNIAAGLRVAAPLDSISVDDAGARRHGGCPLTSTPGRDRRQG